MQRLALHRIPKEMLGKEGDKVDTKNAVGQNSFKKGKLSSDTNL